MDFLFHSAIVEKKYLSEDSKTRGTLSDDQLLELSKNPPSTWQQDSDGFFFSSNTVFMNFPDLPGFPFDIFGWPSVVETQMEYLYNSNNYDYYGENVSIGNPMPVSDICESPYPLPDGSCHQPKTFAGKAGQPYQRLVPSKYCEKHGRKDAPRCRTDHKL